MSDLVPVIDISDPSATETAALDAACRDHGFFLLSGHGLDDLIARTFSEGQQFFDADRSVKESVRRTQERALGYFDRELTKRRRDHKEVFDFIDPERGGENSPNQWPTVDTAFRQTAFRQTAFRQTMTEFFDAFAELAVQTTALVLNTLGLDDEPIEGHRGSRLSSAVRLNHYNIGDPVPEDERDGLAELGETALGYHTDPGVLTLLLQDGVGGLQAESTEHGWIDVAPKPGTIVVNLADSLQVWSNDQYRAAVHRVQPMTTETRMSIPFFYNPPSDAVIEPITALVNDQQRYRSFTWREFMSARNADNFEDLGEADTQISNYALR